MSLADHRHAGQPLLHRGEAIETARAAMILIHGRGATAASILDLTTVLKQPGFAYFAPQARHSTWYPYSFLMELEENEPDLSSALTVISDLVDQLEGSGIPLERIVLLGFSQGACLVTEYAARNARRYGGICGLSGGLIGAPSTPREYPGSLAGTPVFLGCSDIDQHIPVERVNETAEVLQSLGGAVDKRIYPGMGHTINADEIQRVNVMMQTLLAEPADEPG